MSKVHAASSILAQVTRRLPLLWAKRGRMNPDVHLQTPDVVLDGLQ